MAVIRGCTIVENEAGTESGDGYEVVDLAALDGKLHNSKPANDGAASVTSANTVPSLLIGEWIRTHQYSEDPDDELKELDILVEIKRPNSDWPRKEMELENRIQVGDFVDAQDVAGKWYEAIVREVTDATVNVHYFGWASRWNSTLQFSMTPMLRWVTPLVLPTGLHPRAPSTRPCAARPP